MTEEWRRVHPSELAPLLDAEARVWLRAAIDRCHPGHGCLARL